MSQDREDYLCKEANKCAYGIVLNGGDRYICGYILKTGKARSLIPEGEIINGKCGLMEPLKRKHNEII